MAEPFSFSLKVNLFNRADSVLAKLLITRVFIWFKWFLDAKRRVYLVTTGILPRHFTPRHPVWSWARRFSFFSSKRKSNEAKWCKMCYFGSIWLIVSLLFVFWWSLLLSPDFGLWNWKFKFNLSRLVRSHCLSEYIFDTQIKFFMQINFKKLLCLHQIDTEVQ